ncbi:MAG: hypothetical protein QM765_01385 [Myxococcales bacterium]
MALAYATVLGSPALIWVALCAWTLKDRRTLGFAYSFTPFLLGIAGVGEVLIRGTEAPPIAALAVPTFWLVALTIGARWTADAVHLLVLSAVVFIPTIGALMVFGLNLHAFFVAIAQHIVVPAQ